MCVKALFGVFAFYMFKFNAIHLLTSAAVGNIAALIK